MYIEFLLGIGKQNLHLSALYNNVQVFHIRMCLSEKIYSMTSLSINELQKSFKKEQKNSPIYLDVIDKLSTFAPALLERQSLMIDILLMIKGSENKNQKTSKKVWMLSEKVLIFASAFVKKAVRRRPHQFFEILINNTSSTSKKIEPSILVRESSDTIEDDRYLNKVNKITAS